MDADAKYELMEELIESRNALKDLFRSYHIQQQYQAKQAEGYFQPLIDELKKPEYETPSNEEIRTFLKRHNIEYNFLVPKAELSFTKNANGEVRVYLGKNPKTWKEITFDKNTMKVEGKEKTFDISNNTTWRLLEGEDPKSLGLSSTQIKKWTKDYIDMQDDRSTVISNVKHIQNITRHEPSEYVFPPDEEFHDDVKKTDSNFQLGEKRPDVDVANLSEVDIERMYRDYFNDLVKSDATKKLISFQNQQLAAYGKLKSDCSAFLPFGSSDFTTEFKKINANQTWDELLDSYNILVSKANKKLSTGNTNKVLNNLKDYMQAKNREKFLVLQFFHQKLNNDYGDTLSNPDAKPQDLTMRWEVSDVYKRLKNNPRIKEFNKILDEHKKKKTKNARKKDQEFLQQLQEQAPEKYEQRQ